MREQESRIRRINQTFSIPLDISQELHTYVKRREMSQFVSEAIRKELDTKKEELRKAYSQANQDQGQLKAMQDFEKALLDGLDEW